jgi:NTE family protein
MPFGVVAVDLITGKKVVFSNISSLPQLPETVFFQKAPLGAAVQASCAIPGVFEPVPYQGTLLADGGLLEMVPAPLARLLGSRKVIGVSLKQKGSVQEPQSLIQDCLNGVEDSELIRTGKKQPYSLIFLIQHYGTAVSGQ